MTHHGIYDVTQRPHPLSGSVVHSLATDCGEEDVAAPKVEDDGDEGSPRSAVVLGPESFTAPPLPPPQPSQPRQPPPPSPPSPPSLPWRTAALKRDALESELRKAWGGGVGNAGVCPCLEFVLCMCIRVYLCA